MNILKLGIAAALVGALYLGYSYFKQAANALGFSIVGLYGLPSLSHWILTVPIQVEFKNPTPASINLDNLTTNVFILKNGQWVQAAVIDQPIFVPAGESSSVINATIDIPSLFGGNILNTVQGLSQILTNSMVQIRADIVAKYGLLTIPQSITQSIPVNI